MKILVTLDGSHFSEAILGTVGRIAAPLAAEVELFTVGRPAQAHATASQPARAEMTPVATSSGTRIDVPLPSAQLAPVAESRAQALARIELDLQEYLKRCSRELPGVSVDTHVVFADDVGEAIVERARETRPDLIAMATHGRGGLSHLLAGSVCETVIRSGVAPVVVLRP